MEVLTLAMGAARRNNLPCGLGLVITEVLGGEGVHAVVDHLEQGHVLELVLGGVPHVDVVAYQCSRVSSSGTGAYLGLRSPPMELKTLWSVYEWFGGTLDKRRE